MSIHSLFQTLRGFAACAFVLGVVAVSSQNAMAQTTNTPPALSATPAPPADSTPSNSSSSTSEQSTPPSSSHKWEIKIGPEVGVFFPTSGKTADRFGSEWWALGIGIGSLQDATEHGNFSLDLTVVSRYGSDSHIFVAPVGLQYIKAIGPTTNSSVPYAGLSGDLVFVDIRSLPDNVHSGFHETGGASAFVGTTLGKKAYIEARYLWNGSVEGFDTSGLNLTAGARF